MSISVPDLLQSIPGGMFAPSSSLSAQESLVNPPVFEERFEVSRRNLEELMASMKQENCSLFYSFDNTFNEFS